MTDDSDTGPRLVVLGNLLLDDVVYADGRTRMAQPGGAALYVALGAALWGVPTAIVTRLGDDYPQAIVDSLARRGVALAGAGGAGRPTLRTWLLYEGRRRRVVHRLDGPSHEEVSPRAAEIPDAWQPAAIHLAPMPWTIQKQLIADLDGRTGVRLSADPYELLTTQDLAEWAEVFGRVDSLFLSEDEMEIPGGLEEPEPVLRGLAADPAGRLRSIFYKRGPAGGLVRHGDEMLAWSARASDVVDPTGAGDSFAGGVLAAEITGEQLERRIQRGVVSASFALQSAGADALFAADREAAERRLAGWFSPQP